MIAEDGCATAALESCSMEDGGDVTDEGSCSLLFPQADIINTAMETAKPEYFMFISLI